MQSVDDSLLGLLNRGAANPALDWLMPRITSLNHERWFMAVMILWVLYWAVRGDRRVRVWLFCALLAVGASDVMAARVAKNLIHRARPCQSAMANGPTAYGDVRLVPGEHCPGSNSFPSNHAANTMGLGAVCWWFSRRKRKEEELAAGPPDSLEFRAAHKRRRTPLLWFLLPLVIGYSRLYLGYHYPSDTLGGWLLGAAVAWLVVTGIAKRLLPSPNPPTSP